jgi:IclR family pca regulon transcriptional regulator
MDPLAERRDPTDNEKNKVRSAAKILAVLSVFTGDEPELSLPEIGVRAGLDRGTTFRLVHTLVSLGYIRASIDNKRFRLTLKCLDIGFNALMSVDLRDEVQPMLRELVPEFADAASYGVLDGDDVVYVVRFESGMSFTGSDRRPGSRTKAYASALGHAMLAYLPREEQIARLEASHRTKLSERTLTDLDDLLARLGEVRARGFAVSDGENAFGLRTVAAAVIDPDEAPVGAVSVTIRSDRMSVEAFVEIASPRVCALARELSNAIALSFGRVGGTPSGRAPAR